MHCNWFSRCSFVFGFGIVASLFVPLEVANAQESLGYRPVRPLAAGMSPVCDRPIASTLGTFEPTPYIMVRGNWPSGGGYSPLETYGDQSMALYGPLSPLRAVAAP